MESSEFYYPVEKTFYDFTKVIPQLVEIINQNESTSFLEIPSFLNVSNQSRTISETIKSEDSSCFFFLQDQNEVNMCYHLSYKKVKEAFDLNVSFSSEFPNGKVRLEFKDLVRNSKLKEKIIKMIKVYANYSKSKETHSLYVKQGEGFAQASVSMKFGFDFGESSTADGRNGGGVSYTLKEFVNEKKGHFQVKSFFSDEELKGLLLAAELRINYAYLFKL